MDEVELVQRSQQGDLEAFNKLVEKYQKEIYNLSFRMLGSVPEAEDASQEAFVLAWKNIRNLKHGNFKAWLLRIITNVCRNQLRKQKQRTKFMLEGCRPSLSQSISTTSLEG